MCSSEDPCVHRQLTGVEAVLGRDLPCANVELSDIGRLLARGQEIGAMFGCHAGSEKRHLAFLLSASTQASFTPRD